MLIVYEELLVVNLVVIITVNSEPCNPYLEDCREDLSQRKKG